MSLLIDADGQLISGAAGSPLWTAGDDFTVFAWVKVTSAAWLNAFAIMDAANDAYNHVVLRAANGTTYDHGISLQGQDRRLDNSGAVTSGWDCVCVTYEKTVSRISYRNGSAVQTVSTNMAEGWSGGVGFDKVVMGYFQHSTGRLRVAHCAVWNVALTSTEVGNLYNGGGGGGGMNPTAVQGSNLKFYMALSADITTVHTGGITMSGTGSPTYDADNPTVDAPGGGGSPTGAARTTRIGGLSARSIYGTTR